MCRYDENRDLKNNDRGNDLEKLLHFDVQTKSWFLQIPTVPQYWVKLTGISKDKNFPNEQTIAQQKLQKP